MDSKLVVEQMSGRWKIKHEDMRRLALQARDLVADISSRRAARCASRGSRGPRTRTPTPWPTRRWTAGRSTAPSAAGAPPSGDEVPGEPDRPPTSRAAPGSDRRGTPTRRGAGAARRHRLHRRGHASTAAAAPTRGSTPPAGPGRRRRPGRGQPRAGPPGPGRHVVAWLAGVRDRRGRGGRRSGSTPVVDADWDEQSLRRLGRPQRRRARRAATATRCARCATTPPTARPGRRVARRHGRARVRRVRAGRRRGRHDRRWSATASRSSSCSPTCSASRTTGSGGWPPRRARSPRSRCGPTARSRCLHQPHLIRVRWPSMSSR